MISLPLSLRLGFMLCLLNYLEVENKSFLAWNRLRLRFQEGLYFYFHDLRLPRSENDPVKIILFWEMRECGSVKGKLGKSKVCQIVSYISKSVVKRRKFESKYEAQLLERRWHHLRRKLTLRLGTQQNCVLKTLPVLEASGDAPPAPFSLQNCCYRFSSSFNYLF